MTDSIPYIQIAGINAGLYNRLQALDQAYEARGALPETPGEFSTADLARANQLTPGTGRLLGAVVANPLEPAFALAIQPLESVARSAASDFERVFTLLDEATNYDDSYCIDIATRVANLGPGAALEFEKVFRLLDATTSYNQSYCADMAVAVAGYGRGAGDEFQQVFELLDAQTSYRHDYIAERAKEVASFQRRGAAADFQRIFDLLDRQTAYQDSYLIDTAMEQLRP